MRAAGEFRDRVRRRGIPEGAPADPGPALPRRKSAFDDLLARVELRNFPFPIRFEIEGVPSFERLFIEYRARDRDTGEEVTIRHSRAVDSYVFHAAPEERFDLFVRFLREALLDVLRHELDEAMRADGVRLFDPHRDEPSR